MTTTPRRPQIRPGPPPDPIGLTEGGRAAVSGAIILLLIGLALSIAGNSDSGSSALVRTVKGRLFSPWLTPAWLDLGFDYRLTYGGAEDADHRLEIGLARDGGRQSATLPGARVGERAARWRRLARAIVLDVDDADRDGLLAAAAGRGMFAALGGEDVLLRVMSTPPSDRGAPPPASASAYAARVRIVDGELQLLRQEARGEVAPLVRPPTAREAIPSRDAR